MELFIELNDITSTDFAHIQQSHKMLDRLVDSLGDLTLVVGPEQTRIRVSRHALRLASPVWNAMLTPNHFQESSSSEIPLEDDDTEALRILLLVAHHRNNILPTKFDSLHKLVEVALLCAQYQMVLVMKRFMDVWKAPWSTVRKEGSWWFVDDVPGCEEMLVIYWIFGYVDHYYKLSATLWPFVKPVYGSDQGDVEVRGRAFLQGKMPAGVIGE